MITSGNKIISKKRDKIKYELQFNDPDPQLRDNVDEPLHPVTTADKKIKREKITKSEKKKRKTLNKISNELEPAKKEQIINPFFVGVNGGTLLALTTKEIYQNYTHTYIMCLRDGIIFDEITLRKIMSIYSLSVDADELKNACSHFMLIKSPVIIVKNYHLKKKSNLIKKEMLSTYFPRTDENQYEMDEIVTFMFEMSELSCKIYIDMYRVIPLNNIQDMMSLSSYYNKMSSVSVESKVNEAIKSIDNGSYWKDPINCNFNMDEIFNQRSLSYNGHRLDQIRYATISGAKTLNNLLTNLGSKKRPSKIRDGDYLSGIHELNENDKLKSEHMNIYQVLRESDKRTFYATVDDGQFPFTKDQIADIFDKIPNEKFRFQLLNTLLTSKEFCHFAINNKRVLQRNADLFQKYKPLYAYILGYAWVTMYLEESIFTTRSTKNHRFIFDIDTAKELPIFPFSMENVHNNPYVTLLLNRDLIDTKTNCMSIDALEEYNKYYGLCSREEALMRFNTFASGNNNENIFRDLNPKIYSFSGSIMPACLMKHCPLIDICTSPDMKYDDKWGTYFTHYYGGADVDVMCGVNTTAEFMAHGTVFLETLVKNIGCSRSNLTITPNKKMAVIVSRHFFRECIDDLNAEIGTNYTPVELIKLFENGLSPNNEEKNTLPSEIIRYFHFDYCQEKNLSIKKWETLQKKSNIIFDRDLVSAFNSISEKSDMVFKTISYDVTSENQKRSDHEIYYFVNDFRAEDQQAPKEKNFLVFKFSESIKYKITSPKLRRTMEIFKVDPIDPFKTVARFHKPCVRAYLQGDTFYMLPSFITAMMSLINIDYKYFAGSRDPIEIINKYRMRGFSVILNANEKKAMAMYNKNVDMSNGMFKITDESNAFGTKDINDKIYKPGVYGLNLPANIYNVSNHKYVRTVEQLRSVYQRECGIDIKNAPLNMLNFTTIGANGTITPYQQWVADAYYNFHQESLLK